MDDQLTADQQMDMVLGQIREYARQHDLSAERVRAVFEAGAFAAQRLGEPPAATDKAA